jgi:hypothetical protein
MINSADEIGDASAIGRRLGYITGSGHSGSTLLNLLLNAHSKISALSEIHRLWLSAHLDAAPHRCGCGEAVLDCPFWTKVGLALQEVTGSDDAHVLQHLVTTDPAYIDIRDDGQRLLNIKPFRTFNPNLNRALMILGSKRLWALAARWSPQVKVQRVAVLNSLLLFEAVRVATGTPVIVDATKNPARMKGLYLAAIDPFLAFQMIRDGRAVCYSRMRRERCSMERAAKIWVGEYRKHRMTQLTMSSASLVSVRYEELASQPSVELPKVCSLLGLPFEENMLDFRAHEHHVIGGNPMRFRRDEGGVRLDESWKREVSPSDIRIFAEIGGRLNRSLGYE